MFAPVNASTMPQWSLRPAGRRKPHDERDLRTINVPAPAAGESFIVGGPTRCQEFDTAGWARGEASGCLPLDANESRRVGAVGGLQAVLLKPSMKCRTSQAQKLGGTCLVAFCAS